MFHLLWQ